MESGVGGEPRFAQRRYGDEGDMGKQYIGSPVGNESLVEVRQRPHNLPRRWCCAPNQGT